MFCSTENASIRMPRAVIMPMPSSDFSHASPSVMARVFWPNSDDVALVGQRRAGHEVDEHFGARGIDAGDRHRRSPGDTVSSRMRSGRSAW